MRGAPPRPARAAPGANGFPQRPGAGPPPPAPRPPRAPRGPRPRHRAGGRAAHRPAPRAPRPAPAAKSRALGVAFSTLDLASSPGARDRMLRAAGATPHQIPQLHVAGTFVGGIRRVQELEDAGELDALLTGAAAPTAPPRERFGEYYAPRVN